MRTPRYVVQSAWAVITCLMTAVAFVAISPTQSPASACVNWTGTQPATIASFQTELLGVAGTSPCDLWAVGNAGASTLVEHWNGSAWKIVGSPNDGAPNWLYGVAALSRTDVWAVGSYTPDLGTHLQTLALHWDGHSWTHIPSPNPGGSTHDDELLAVAAVSAKNAWAVGWYDDGTADRTLIEHWNGTKWRRVASPNFGSEQILQSVAATSARNLWAVGKFLGAHSYRTLVLRWNGMAWKHVASPNAGTSTDANTLFSVSATSATNAWAVGRHGSSTDTRTLIEHWAGRAWHIMTGAALPGGYRELRGVASISTSDTWAVGKYRNGAGYDRTAVEHWNGTSWKREATPNFSTYDNHLLGVAAFTPSQVWAVGRYSDGSNYVPLAIHCC